VSTNVLFCSIKLIRDGFKNGYFYPKIIMAKNINKIKLPSKDKLSAKDYFTEIKLGNRTILSKAITLIESSNTEHQSIAEELIELCLPHSGNSIRVGITGVPGVGKSTFIESLGTYLTESQNKKVAVLAIDPSSKKSGGSILGDKTRMNRLSVNNNAFVRPSPSSGTLGGVAKATRETIILCEAAGFDTILIETVGVGQSEIEVKSMVDFFLLLMLAGAGDELQGIKRGIMEIADAVVINKADGDNINHAKSASGEYKNALHLFPPNPNHWISKVATCSSIEDKGIAHVWEIIEDFKHLTTSNGHFDSTRKKQSKYWLEHTIDGNLRSLFYGNETVKKELIKLEDEVVNGKTSPFKAAKDLLALFKNQS
jgi:LAO/AO transport system kinase